jgi:hypothetical protein
MSDGVELAFKIVFFIAVLVFCLAIVGVFLLIVKIIFLFMPNFVLMGIKFAPAVSTALTQ